MENRLNQKELAKVLGISTKTLQRRLKKPDCSIPYHVLGKRKYFFMSEILSTTKAVIDKEEVLNMLDALVKNKCLYSTDNLCIHDEIKDVIRFIKGEPK